MFRPYLLASSWRRRVARSQVARSYERVTPSMTVLPASARFVVPASTAAASKLVLFDVMDTIVADPFFRGFHKVAHAPRPDATKRRTQAAKQQQP